MSLHGQKTKDHSCVYIYTYVHVHVYIYMHTNKKLTLVQTNSF